MRVPVRLGSLRATVRDSPAVAVHDARSDGGGGGTLLSTASAARVCRVCTQHAARYTCPRCNAPYCGVACFQRHGDACTERFYEEMVRGAVAMEGGGGSGDEKRAVGELLARVRHFQDEAVDGAALADDDDDDDDDALERLGRLALTGEQQLSLDDLTPAQRRQFLAEVADGRLGKFVRLWQPWWRLAPRVYTRETAGRRRQLVIQEIGASPAAEEGDDGDDDDGDEDEASEGDVLIESAAFPAAIFTDAAARAMPASLDALLGGRAPAPALRFHLAEILFSYALVLRTFNGDWQQAPGEAAALLLHLSAVLSRADGAAAALDAADLVLHACLRKRADVAAADGDSVDAVDVTSSHNSDVNQLAVRDATVLLASRVFLLDALSDARALLDAAATQLAAERRSAKSARRQLVRVGQKLAFFQTWVFVSPEQLFAATARELEAAAEAAAGR